MNGEHGVKHGDEAYNFHAGSSKRAHEYLGAHLLEESEGRYIYAFRTFAKRAISVELTGDFNFWGASPMHRVSEAGIFELIYESDIPLEGMRYKYRIFSSGGQALKKDPFARYGEWESGGASIIFSDSEKYEWNDQKWLDSRRPLTDGENFCSAPINIYELHLGSWKTRDGKSAAGGNAYLDYRELADELCEYASDMGYTHVCLLPIAEYSQSSPRGYATESYFAPSARFGNPNGFKYFVDKLHGSGVGVISELPLLRFSDSEGALADFDGRGTYESDISERGKRKTRAFDLARAEVRSFLISAALFWMREYHIDGVSVGDISGALYKNGRESEEAPEAAAFFRELNSSVRAEFPSAFTIAGEGGGRPLVTAPIELGGLGFSFRLNGGWARDAQNYCATDPYYRENKHRGLTFSLRYAFGENYILPITHADVSGGNGSLLDKMFGGYESKFATLRAFLGYMTAHPGKKMLFMGSEFGQFREWDAENQLEWFLSDFEAHEKLQIYVRELNRFYSSHGALWERDFSQNGFRWISERAKKDNLIAFARIGEGSELICIMNFSPAAHNGYRLALGSEDGFYREALNSDSEAFGGKGRENRGLTECESGEIKLDIPPLSAIFLERVDDFDDVTVEVI